MVERTQNVARWLAFVGWGLAVLTGSGLAADAPPSRRDGWPDLSVRQFLENQPVSERKQVVLDPESGDYERYYLGNVRWEYETRGQRIVLECDRLVFYAPGVLGRIDASGARLEQPDTPLEFSVFADGNVRVEIPGEDTILEAESALYDHTERLLVARDARVETTVGGVQRVLSSMEDRDVRGTRPHRRDDLFHTMPFVLRAEILKSRDFRTYEGRGLSFTSCDFGVPHYELSAGSASAVRMRGEGAGAGTRPSIGADTGEPERETRPEEAATGRDGSAGPSAGGARGGDGGEDYFVLNLDALELQVAETPVLPLPSLTWDTRWNNYFPVRSVDLGISNKYGAFGSLDWNLNFFIDQLPVKDVSWLRSILDESRLDFETTYMSTRGFGWGPIGQYGTRPRGWRPWQLELDGWTYYGESRYFALRDDGEDRSGLGGPPPDKDRHWADVNHRQAIPYLGIVDVEYSDLSDRNFLREFFEGIQKEEKQQESLFSLRRNFRDNLAVTGLYKYRVNDFESTVERIPEGRFLALQEPVFSTGLYTDVVGQAANLRIRPADELGLQSTRLWRADLANEWSYPLSLGRYLAVRPFGLMRFSAYEELVDPTLGSEGRATFGAGMTASQEWSRVFHLAQGSFLREFLRADRIRHVLVPKVTYTNLFANDLDPDLTFNIDEVDAVDKRESVSVSLRQALYRRGSDPSVRGKVRPLVQDREALLDAVDYRVSPLLDSETRFVLFPRPNRDNEGDRSSLLILNNTLYPHSSFSLRAWLALDPNEDFRVDRFDGSLTVDVLPDVLSTTVGDRFTRRGADGADSNNFVYGLMTLYVGEKWRFQGYYSYDIEQRQEVEYSFALARVFHRFALILEYSVDVGEDRNQTISVNFSPIDLVGGMRAGRQRRW